MISELIYFADSADYDMCKKAILGVYPDAVIKDASDYIHQDRFEVEIADIEQEEWYKFALREGFFTLMLGGQLDLHMKTDYIRSLFEQVKAEEADVPESTTTTGHETGAGETS